MEEPPARKEHQCCCVFISPGGNEDACSFMADADSPFCINCERHQQPGYVPNLGEGWQIIARIPRKKEQS